MTFPVNWWQPGLYVFVNKHSSSKLALGYSSNIPLLNGTCHYCLEEEEAEPDRDRGRGVADAFTSISFSWRGSKRFGLGHYVAFFSPKARNQRRLWLRSQSYLPLPGQRCSSAGLFKLLLILLLGRSMEELAPFRHQTRWLTRNLQIETKNLSFHRPFHWLVVSHRPFNWLVVSHRPFNWLAASHPPWTSVCVCVCVCVCVSVRVCMCVCVCVFYHINIDWLWLYD